MPVEPRQLEQLVRSPEFSALGPQDKLSAFRSFIAENDEEFRGFGQQAQISASQDLLEHYTPGWGSTVADVAEYVPVVGGAVRGYRNEEVRPLTGAIFGQPTTTGGRMAAEVARDVGELGLAAGATKLAMPAIDALAGRIAGGTLEGTIAGALGRKGATTLTDEALTAATSGAARRIAGEAARVALRERWARRGLEQIPQAGLFGATMALEGEIQNGELPPLSDILATTAGAAALGLGFYGAGDLIRKFKLRSMDEVVGAAAKFDPERFAKVQRNVSEAAEAIRRASGGRLDREGAADLTLTALTEPIEAVGDVRAIKDALRNNPELLGSEVGLHLLRTQRALHTPDVQFVDGPYLRVTFDDETGRTVTQDLSERGAQAEFRKRLAAGQITVDNVVGDQASVLRAGIRPGEPIMPVVSPGGRAALVPEGAAPTAFGEFNPQQLPIVRPAPTLGDEIAMAVREIRTQGATAPGGPLDVPGIRLGAMPHAESATSVEAINRLASERGRGVTYAAVDVRGKGRERVVPGTVDRVDVRPGPFEIIVKRGATPKDVIVEAGAKVRPEQLKRVRAAEVARFEGEVAALRQNPQQALPAPATPENVLVTPEGTRPITVRELNTKPPAPGTTARTTVNAVPVRVLSEGDAIGRAVVELPGGQSARVQWNPIRQTFDVPDDLLTLPRVEGTAPALTLEAPVVKPEFRAQIRPGQVLHQTISDLEKRGVRSSLEVLAVDGDRVLLQDNNGVVREVTVDDVAYTVERGAARPAFDMTKAPQEQIEALGARFRDVFDRPAGRAPTAEELRADAQIARDLYAFNRTTAGQDAAPGTVGPDPNVGLREANRKQNDTPAGQRTRGGSRLVKGCKVK